MSLPSANLPSALAASKPGEDGCTRCQCTETHACHDPRLRSPCAWSHLENVCTACLTEAEFETFLDHHPELQIGL